MEAFEAAAIALDSEVDINPGMESAQAKVRDIAAAIKDPAERARVDKVIRSKAFADFNAASHIIGRGTIRNGWARAAGCGHFGTDWLTRTFVKCIDASYPIRLIASC